MFSHLRAASRGEVRVATGILSYLKIIINAESHLDFSILFFPHFNRKRPGWNGGAYARPTEGEGQGGAADVAHVKVHF